MLFDKVRWQDGDLITEKHFQLLEAWIESLSVIKSPSVEGYGLISMRSLAEDYNDQDRNIKFEIISNENIFITLDHWFAISPEGRAICIEKAENIELALDKSFVREDGFFNLYIMPTTKKNGAIGAARTVEESPVLYTPYHLAIQDSENQGICICRFKQKKNEVILDTEFIPVCYDISGSNRLIEMHNSILAELEEIKNRIIAYIKDESADRSIPAIDSFIMNLYKSIAWHSSQLLNKNQTLLHFISTFQAFFEYIASEFELLVLLKLESLNNQDDLEDFADQLAQPITPYYKGKFSINAEFSALLEKIKILGQSLESLPKFPKTSLSIDIDRVEFEEHDGVFNKLSIHFKKEYQFRQDDSLLLLLDTYSTQPPPKNSRKVRFTVKDRSFVRLRAHDGLFEHSEEQSNNYKIKCPAKLFEATKINTFTIYVPSPLGENIDRDAHLKHIKCQLESKNTVEE